VAGVKLTEFINCANFGQEGQP